MDKLVLVIGNKNYSSWSMRPWLLMSHRQIPFEEIRIPLYTPESGAALARHSPSGLVPVLKDGSLNVWDSLAICEYLNEKFPALHLWPEAAADRAVARSMSAEMHSGFSALRQNMSMSIRASRPGKGLTPDSAKDIGRIVSLWSECRAQHGKQGDFLFGRFSIADAMFSPIVLRFRTYDVKLEGAVRDYADAMLALPAMQKWIAEAVAEVEKIERFDMND